jgi:mono/diheme cytochrome c family protein
MLTGLALLLVASHRDAAPAGGQMVSFRRQIQPIFDQTCASCHPGSYPYLDLRPGHAYRDLVGVPATTAPSYERVLPGRPDLSYLVIGPEDPSRRGLLTRHQRRLIAAWIRQGARDN